MHTYEHRNMSGEAGYLDLLRLLLEQGKPRQDRTGTGTRSSFGHVLRFDLNNDTLPLFTTKKMAWKACLKELLWFLRGSTDARELRRENVHIWDANSTRAFLDQRRLFDLPEGDVGATYGFQWRRFGAPYVNCERAHEMQGFDQIEYVSQLIANEPTSRRIFMSAWNPAMMDRMALPPCHVSTQFYVDPDDKTLSCLMTQRSADCFLGLPFNVASYGCLCHLMAHRHGLRAKELIVSIGDAHLYENHLEAARELLSRTPLPFPRLRLSETSKLCDWSELSPSDFEVLGYASWPAIRAPMNA